MVNRGRSAGCVTCKQRRVKCDEAKPGCRTCERLGLDCGGYCKPLARLKFKECNQKVLAATPNNCGADERSTSKFVTTCSSRPSRSNVHKDGTGDSLTVRRLSEPDCAVPFYLEHYAGMGRDMESTRGFYELLVPAYLSQPQDSTLSLALTTLGAEVLSVWRQNRSSFRVPRSSYSRALAGLRVALSDSTERAKPATVLAVLVLQAYENASAVYGLRLASRAHHEGAASLFTRLDTDATKTAMHAHLRRFMLHTEVSSALRQKRPLKEDAYTWIGHRDVVYGTANPSTALDIIGASVAELQASYAQLSKLRASRTTSYCVLREWLAQAKRLDEKLLDWAENVPLHWRPSRLTGDHDIDASITCYQSVCEVYPSCQIASIWNLWRSQRLILVTVSLGTLMALITHEGVPLFTHLTTFSGLQTTLQAMVDGICYSIPFHLGNRSTLPVLTDFSDPNFKLPSDSLPDRGARATSTNHDRRHIIAQGLWRVMHPLSCLMTLFSEEEGEVIANLLRVGQQEWIEGQFVRVTSLLTLEPGHCISGSRPIGSCSHTEAAVLAKRLRKGAVMMSGP